MSTNLRIVDAVTVDRIAEAIARRHAELPLAPDELGALLDHLRLRDASGAFWTLGPWTRRWYRFAAGAWVPSADHPTRFEAPAELLRACDVAVHPSSSLDADLVESPPPERLGPGLLAEIVHDLRARYDAGATDSDTVEELLREYYLIDLDGQCWTVGYATSDWYWFEAGAWRRCGSPPDPARVLRLSAPPAPLEIIGLTPEIARAIDDFLVTGSGTLPEQVSAPWEPPVGFPELPPEIALRCPRCGSVNAGATSSCLRCAAPIAPPPPPRVRRMRARRIVIALFVAAVLATAGTAAVSYVSDNYFLSSEQMFARGENYLHGTYSPRDVAAAVHWYRRAAEDGHAGAQYVLGTLYLDGIGVERDRATGVSWLQRAAQQGHADARALLGRLGAAW